MILLKNIYTWENAILQLFFKVPFCFLDINLLVKIMEINELI